MNKKSFFSRKVASIVACLTILALIAGCNSNKDNPENPIAVGDVRQLDQTVYADKTSGASNVIVSTTGAWISRIVEKLQTKADAPVWISISPDHGDGAGDYTIAITLTPNYTGEDRTATVTISCGGTDMVVTITQKATKEDGTKPVEEVAVTGVSLSETSKNLAPGATFALTATVAPDNATNKTIVWTSSNAGV